MADEFIDILHKTGEFTGEVRLKSEAHQLGLYHASVHIWFFTAQGEILLQKRADNKDTYPGLWDVSVAGHIGTGETPEDSAIREVKEEIGLSVSKNDLMFIGTYLAEKMPGPDLYDNEFHHIYLSRLEVSIETLTLQEEEVSDLTLIDINELKNILKVPIKATDYVPHDAAYYDFILKKITNQL
ncbi:isopentenyldiphosphate isomerase [Aquimarina sp. EL_43]|uniref:NUDIX hydrolase n=1 Tax=unclassified Aquimarina TaxID=2627091 RepID=UPI0018CABBD5|nr:MULTISPECIES: NUDIX domain-containing protein [unclassified Aquimarina]MBG6133552.1 isopentenyldiphosphate isomerase [Aquimarina sp. EL_35]MBG6153655.1 isopentenyldiphosphate isomerase [Aquimarina sp. EL_32]MBG6171866.1 isopentenyldiphosphate isomerase [Aquimarina sp. EL_43]